MCRDGIGKSKGIGHSVEALHKGDHEGGNGSWCRKGLERVLFSGLNSLRLDWT